MDKSYQSMEEFLTGYAKDKGVRCDVTQCLGWFYVIRDNEILIEHPDHRAILWYIDWSADMGKLVDTLLSEK